MLRFTLKQSIKTIWTCFVLMWTLKSDLMLNVKTHEWQCEFCEKNFTFKKYLKCHTKFPMNRTHMTLLRLSPCNFFSQNLHQIQDNILNLYFPIISIIFRPMPLKHATHKKFLWWKLLSQGMQELIMAECSFVFAVHSKSGG